MSSRSNGRIWSNEQFDALQTARIFHRNNGNPEVCTYGVVVSSEAWGGSKEIRDLEKERETQGEKIRQLETGIKVQNSVIEELKVKLTFSESAFKEIDSKFHELLVEKNQLEQQIVTDQYAHGAEMCSLKNEVSNTSHFPLLKSWETTKVDLFMKGNKECGLGMEKSVPDFAVKSREFNELQVGYNHTVLSNSDLSVKVLTAKWEEMRKHEMVAHGFYWGNKGRVG